MNKITRSQFAIRFVGWTLLALFLIYGTKCKAQSNVKTYQVGTFKGQKQKPTNISISATIIDKYVNKGYHWVIGLQHNTTYAFLITDTAQYRRYEKGNLIVVGNVMPINTSDYKRRKLTK